MAALLAAVKSDLVDSAWLVEPSIEEEPKATAELEQIAAVVAGWAIALALAAAMAARTASAWQAVPEWATGLATAEEVALVPQAYSN